MVDTSATADRIVILSDTHLGRNHAAARSAAALRPLWHGASLLIINGDVAEVHHPEHWSVAARQTLHLHDLCEEDGVSLTLLSGNHDPYISDIRHLHLVNQQVFVSHGDVLHPAVAPWSPVAGRIRAAYELALGAIDPESRDELERRLEASQHASAHVELERMTQEAGRSSVLGMLMRPWAVARVLWYWRIFPSLAERFLVEHAPAARWGIFGHTHRQGVWTVNERVIINTGSFGFPGSPLAVVIEQSELTVWPIVLSQGVYAFASKPTARYQLPDSCAIDSEHAAGQLATKSSGNVPACSKERL